MPANLHVRTGDMVEVIAGDARGSRGKVIRTLPKKNRVVVEGLNIVVKHMRRSRQHIKGGRIEMEAPIDASNVMLICQKKDCKKHDKPVRTKVSEAKDGRTIRACAKCGAEIPKTE